MSRILLCIYFFLFIGLNLNAQNSSGYFNITGKVKVEQGLVEGTSIQIFRDGALLNTFVVNRTGNFRVRVDLNHIYRFSFGQKDFYPKIIEFDTHIPPEVCDQNCVFPPYQLALMLFKKVPGVQEGNSEVGRISYNSKVDNFDAEMLRESSPGINELGEILKEIKSSSKKYEDQGSNTQKEKYRRAISDADALYQAKDYEKAMLRYRDAVMIFPQIQYPRNRVNQLFAILVDSQVREILGPDSEANFLKYLNYGDSKFKEREYTVAKVCYEKALKIKPNDASIKGKLYTTNQELRKGKDLAMKEVAHHQTVYQSRTVKYQELVQKGDEFFKNEDMAEAKDYYAQAATQIDENSYAMLMIRKIDELISDDDAALQLAREREEAEKERLRMARNQAYNDAVSEADRLLDQRLYRDAIEYYELALTVKSFELYPQNQIRIIRNVLANLQLKGEEYNRLLRDGDAFFYEREFEKARPLFVQAHQLISSEKYAQDKVAEIDRLLKSSQSERELEQQYQTFISTADQLFDTQKFTEAIETYQQALKVKSNESYPRTQIIKIRGILSREDDQQKRLLTQQNNFDQFVLDADNAFNQQSYQQARSLYQKALLILPGQEYPKTQMDKIERILEEKKRLDANKSKLEQIDFSNLSDVSTEDRQAAYEEAMTLGKSFIQTKEWGIARFYFRRALALFPNDDKASQKLSEVDLQIRGSNVNESKYNEMVKKADEAYKTGDFGVAKFYYGKAKEAKPEDTYAQERLNVVTQMAENTANRSMNREFDTSLKKANEALNVKNYSVARFFYRKALSLKPNDQATKKKLAEIEALINQN